MRDGPVARAGQAVGLLGGSFDPAHAGHVAVTQTALVRFRLDRLWWLVTPGNPLKAQGPAPLAERMARAREVMQHPKVTVTDIEARLGTRYTAETLRALQAAYPGVRFVWLMGADNLVQFDQWQDWRWIMRSVPVGVLARPGERIAARTSTAARLFRHARRPERDAPRLAHLDPPAWVFLDMPMLKVSSSAIRSGEISQP